MLDDDLDMDVHNLSFKKSQQRIVQAQRKKLPEDHTSLVHIEERVIVSNVRRHPTTMVEASQAYVEATSSAVKFLIAENDRMAKDLQEARQKIE